jgi:hypothetical protein
VQATVVIAAIPKDAMVMDANQVKAGSTVPQRQLARSM